MKPFPVRRWHKALQLFSGKDMHNPHVVFLNAQNTFPSDPSFQLSAQFNCSIVGFILCFSLYYFNDPLTESDWKNPINFSDTVGDVDGHKSACSLACNSSRAPRGRQTVSRFDLQNLAASSAEKSCKSRHRRSTTDRSSWCSWQMVSNSFSSLTMAIPAWKT